MSCFRLKVVHKDLDNTMDKALQLLQTYSGRDKFVRTASYVGMLLAGTAKGKSAERCASVSKQLSAARVMLRWFDDLPMLAVTTTYGLGKHEPDPVLRTLSVIGNMAGQVYFPLEHIAWLADNNILPINSSKWWTAGIWAWTVSLVTAILKGLRNIGIIRHKRAKLLRQRKLESPDKSDSSEKDFKQELAKLNWQEFNDFLTVLRCCTDLLNAVNWLPKGVLWSGKFSTAQSGVFGLVASVIGLYQLALAAK